MDFRRTTNQLGQPKHRGEDVESIPASPLAWSSQTSMVSERSFWSRSQSVVSGASGEALLEGPGEILTDSGLVGGIYGCTCFLICLFFLPCWHLLYLTQYHETPVQLLPRSNGQWHGGASAAYRTWYSIDRKRGALTMRAPR